MANTDPAPYSAPSVRDSSSKPPGLLPRGTQARVIGGIALLMVIMIAFSGRNTPKERNATPPTESAVVDPSAARIQEYRARIDEQAKKLAIEQAQWTQARQSVGGTPSTGLMSDEAGAAPGQSGYPSYATPDRERDSIQADKRGSSPICMQLLRV